jgi:hypothetical protein
MKSFLKRSLFSVATVLMASLAVPQAHGQAEENQPVPVQHANEAQMPASGAATTQESKSFSGIVMQGQ